MYVIVVQCYFCYLNIQGFSHTVFFYCSVRILAGWLVEFDQIMVILYLFDFKIVQHKQI